MDHKKDQMITEEEVAERDRLLRCLLNTPPHHRPKRERGKIVPPEGDGKKKETPAK